MNAFVHSYLKLKIIFCLKQCCCLSNSLYVSVRRSEAPGVFWNALKTRDNRRRFPGTAEKTLHRQGLESVSVEGTTAGEEGEDPLQWPGVRPPEVGPS